MTSTYIQFDAPNSIPPNDGPIRKSIKKTIVGILKKLLPLANHDYEDKIDLVKYWLVEIDNDSGIPQREIGIDSQGRAMIAKVIARGEIYPTI